MVPDDSVGNDGVRHVHFAPEIPSPQPKRLQDPVADAEANAPGPSRRPLRKTSSVKAAVERFNTGGDDADPSILLPVPHSSPARTGKSRGKGRVIEAWDDVEVGDMSGEVRVRGKERELVVAREEQQRHERRREKEGKAKEAEEAEREKALDKERIKALEEEIAWLKQEVGFFLPAVFRVAKIAI
jgi:hypothetical protein